MLYGNSEFPVYKERLSKIHFSLEEEETGKDEIESTAETGSFSSRPFNDEFLESDEWHL